MGEEEPKRGAPEVEIERWAQDLAAKTATARGLLDKRRVRARERCNALEAALEEDIAELHDMLREVRARSATIENAFADASQRMQTACDDAVRMRLRQ